jgi:hypothetical protein
VPESKSQSGSLFYGRTLSQVFTTCAQLIATKGEQVFLLLALYLYCGIQRVPIWGNGCKTQREVQWRNRVFIVSEMTTRKCLGRSEKYIEGVSLALMLYSERIRLKDSVGLAAILTQRLFMVFLYPFRRKVSVALCTETLVGFPFMFICISHSMLLKT